MEPKSGHKESVVSRLFGFGRKKEEAAASESPVASGASPGEESGFARAEPDTKVDARIDTSGDEPSVTIPEQVIRIRTQPARRKDEMVQAIGDSFKELTSMLGNVSDRLDRQDGRSVDLTDQLRELPEYLRSLPRLAEEQNEALRGIGKNVADGTQSMSAALQRLPDIHERQTQAMVSLGDKISEGNEAVHGISDTIARIPEEMRERAQVQETVMREAASAQSEAIRESATKQSEAMRQVATSQEKMAKVVYTGQQKSMQLFQQATNKTIQTVQQQARQQQQQMEGIIQASVDSMRKMFWLAVGVIGTGVVAAVVFFFTK